MKDYKFWAGVPGSPGRRKDYKLRAGVPGAPGSPGRRGERGAVFIPHISEDGVLSWTNDGGLPNPEPVEIGGGEGAFCAVYEQTTFDEIDDAVSDGKQVFAYRPFSYYYVLSGYTFGEDKGGSYYRYSFTRLDTTGGGVQHIDVVTCNSRDVWTQAQSSIADFAAETFDTVTAAARKAGDLKAGAYIRTRGYYSPGDEGGAVYRVTAAADAGKPWQISIGSGKYLEIAETERVSYRMFGAKLDGETDDGAAIKNCHDYANSIRYPDANGKSFVYPCRVENHQGIIYKANADPVYAYTDVDLSGSTIVMDDSNCAWFGFYIWGDNASRVYPYEFGPTLLESLKADNARLSFDHKADLPPNTVLYLDEKPYAMRNDGSNYYTVERMELMVHHQDGWCVSPVFDDWSDGADLFSVEIGDEDSANVYGNKLAWYNYIPSTHGHFTGCRVKYECSGPNKTSAVLWVRRHNCTVSDFTLEPALDNLQNSLYKNASIYVYGCYNVTLENINGLNNAGKRLANSGNATSGYAIRLFGCDTLTIRNCNLSGFWGAIAGSQVKNLTIRDTKSNRLDIHDGVYNCLIDNCVLYTHAIQIGYGRGNLTVENSKFYFSYHGDDCYQALYMIALQATYGRIFSGKIHVRNCEAYCYTNPSEAAHNYKIVQVGFDDVSQSLIPHYEYPELNIESVRIWSDDPVHTNLWYAYVAGTRTAKSGYLAPSLAVGDVVDNTAVWTYIDRTLDFLDGEATVDERTALPTGCVIRCVTTMSGSDGTAILGTDYYEVVTGGAVDPDDEMPSDSSGEEFSWGGCTLKHIGDAAWRSNHSYSAGDLCVSAYSPYIKGYCFSCKTAGTSNGSAPVHSSGTAVDDPGENLEPITWRYEKTLGAGELVAYAPGATVTTGQYMSFNGGLVLVTSGGTLSNTLPAFEWFEETLCGTARLQYVGILWRPHTWVADGGYCVNEGKLYKNVGGNGGTTSGRPLQKPSGILIDGKIIWQVLAEAPASYSAWAARTEYDVGDCVEIDGNYYECLFNGRLGLPKAFYFGDVRTNAAHQYGWVFDAGCSVAAAEQAGDIVTKFMDDDLEQAVLNASASTKPFGKDDNPDITCYVRTPGEIAALSDRVEALEGGKYYAKIKLAYSGATSRTRITLPYDTVAGVYRVTNVCSVSAGAAVALGVTDNTTSGTIAANSSAYLKMPVGDASSSAGKQIIFVVYPGSANSGEFTITIERTSVTDDVTNVDIDFATIVILTQPQDVTCTAGTSVTWTIQVSRSDVTYQWQYYYNGQWTDFTGGTSASLTKTPPSTSWNGWKIRCIVTDANDPSVTVTSREAALSVTAS